MEGEPSAVADSATEAQAAPPAAAEPADVTHGEQTEPEAPPTDADAQADVDEPDDDDAETEPSEEDTPEEAKSKAQKRRERRLQREQERIDQRVAERLAAKEREQQAEAERQKREADTQKAREQAAKEFAEYIGEEGEDGRLRGELDDLNRQIRSEIGTLTQEQFDEIESSIKSKEARIADIRKARAFQDKIGQNIWNGIEAHVYSPLGWAELSDPATKQRYLGAEGGIAGALLVLKDVLRQSWQAEADAEKAATKKAHDSEVATLREEMRGWRVRAGAEEVPDTSNGGAAVSGTMSREQFLALPKDQKDRMRREQPGVVAEIYARSA